MSLKFKIILYFILLDVLLFTLMATLGFVYYDQSKQKEVHERRYESRLLAEELRRTSDDLTRMARTYVETGDIRFLDYFNDIADIRDGKKPRPLDYQHPYWDFKSADADYDAPFGERISIIDRMSDLQFSEKEIEILSEAKHRSDKLIDLERKAFALIQESLDENPAKQKASQEQARALLFGQEYHEQKAQIMERIDAFFHLLDVRTQREVNAIENNDVHYIMISLSLTLFMNIIGLFGYWLFRENIISPLENLSEWVTHMKNGNFDFDTSKLNKDEIGQLARSFSTMAQQVEKYIDELHKVTQTDPLTQLNNRIALDKALRTEWYNFARYKTPCTVIMLDIDHFKRVNDEYGHPVGDKVLTEISSLLKANTRESDMPGRWGGEEFLIICPNTNLDEAHALAEIIRERVARHQFTDVGHLTVSLGVANFEKNASVEDAVRNADERLYDAKHKGRNQVC